jgi:hypothetical protein
VRLPTSCNNSGVIVQANEPRSYKRSKHILWHYHHIREIINQGHVKVCKVLTDQNVVHPLMKPSCAHEVHVY